MQTQVESLPVSSDGEGRDLCSLRCSGAWKVILSSRDLSAAFEGYGSGRAHSMHILLVGELIVFCHLHLWLRSEYPTLSAAFFLSTWGFRKYEEPGNGVTSLYGFLTYRL